MSDNKKKSADWNSEEKTKEASAANKDKKFNSKKLKHGAMATAFTCVFIAVVVLVNVICTILFDKYPITLDLTENKIYSISEEAEKYIKKIDKDVKVTVLANRDDFESFGGEYTKSACEILEKYAKHNDKIDIKYIDFLSNPDVLSDYADQSNLGAYDIIFETSSKDSEGNEFKRVKVVGLMDMVNIKDEIIEYYVSAGYDTSSIDSEIETYVLNYGHSSTFSLYNSYGMLGTSNAETAFVSAFMAVSDENPVTVTFLNANRNEEELKYFRSLLDANGYMVNEINISTEDIPESSNILVMAAPKIDYTPEEIKKIDEFLDNDGNLNKHLIYMASVEQAETPNIDEFLEEYGIAIENKLIGESEAGYYYQGNPFLTRQFLVGEFYLDNYNKGSNPYFYVPYSRNVKALFEEDGMKTVWPYLSTSANAYTADVKTEEVEKTGILYSMVIAGKGKFMSDDAAGTTWTDFSHILAFGTEGFFADSALASPQFENSDFIISILNEMTNKKQGLVITPKAVNAVTFDITEEQANGLKYAFVFVIPIVTLVIGFVIYIKRKNK